MGFDKRIEQIMIRNVLTVGSGAPVQKAAELMASQGVGALVVLERGRPVGMLSERDVVVRVMAMRLDPRATRVGAVMTRDFVSMDPAGSTAAAARLMRANNLRHCPVICRGQLVGIISIRDVIGSLMEDEVEVVWQRKAREKRIETALRKRPARAGRRAVRPRRERSSPSR